MALDGIEIKDPKNARIIKIQKSISPAQIAMALFTAGKQMDLIAFKNPSYITETNLQLLSLVSLCVGFSPKDDESTEKALKCARNWQRRIKMVDPQGDLLAIQVNDQLPSYRVSPITRKQSLADVRNLDLRNSPQQSKQEQGGSQSPGKKQQAVTPETARKTPKGGFKCCAAPVTDEELA